MSEQYFFSTVWVTISSEGSSQSTSNRLAEHAFEPVRAFEQAAWALESALRERGGVDRAHPRHPG